MFSVFALFQAHIWRTHRTWVSPARSRCCPSLLAPSSCLSIARSTRASVGESRMPAGIVAGSEQRVIAEGPTLFTSECTNIAHILEGTRSDTLATKCGTQLSRCLLATWVYVRLSSGSTMTTSDGKHAVDAHTIGGRFAFRE